jgi:hypothetical protein
MTHAKSETGATRGKHEMTGFVLQSIPYLRALGSSPVGEFLTALEEVLELGSRYVVRLGGATVLAGAGDLMLGPRGLGVAGTPLLIPFDDTLAMTERTPEHFRMPAQPSSRYRRTAFGYVAGLDRTFGMISRDDDMEPGRHSREALTEAIGDMKKTAALHGRLPTVSIRPARGAVRTTEGVLIDEDGFRSPMSGEEVLWRDVVMFEIADRVRITCEGRTVEVVG